MSRLTGGSTLEKLLQKRSFSLSFRSFNFESLTRDQDSQAAAGMTYLTADMSFVDMRNEPISKVVTCSQIKRMGNQNSWAESCVINRRSQREYGIGPYGYVWTGGGDEGRGSSCGFDLPPKKNTKESCHKKYVPCRSIAADLQLLFIYSFFLFPIFRAVAGSLCLLGVYIYLLRDLPCDLRSRLSSPPPTSQSCYCLSLSMPSRPPRLARRILLRD